MKCKICEREADRLYVHLNSCHKMRIGDYFEKFPEQRAEYKKKPQWNKGLTKENNESVRRAAAAMKDYCNMPAIRKDRSVRLKKRYENGDILTSEQRAVVAKCGSDGWVSKIKNSNIDERRKLLENFVKAGNEAQKERREFLTPKDYQRLYPFAKGKAQYHNCDFCGKQMIAWFGGKPRPKLRFCGNECWNKYKEEHPCYIFSSNVKLYYSEKMGVEYCLRSNYEVWFAKLLDESEKVLNWATTPYVINYELNGKNRRYYPDFLVNEKYLIEIKSNYTFNLHPEMVMAKIKAAEKFCEDRKLDYIYWQFNEDNFSLEKLKQEIRVRKFFRELV